MRLCFDGGADGGVGNTFLEDGVGFDFDEGFSIDEAGDFDDGGGGADVAEEGAIDE